MSSTPTTAGAAHKAGAQFHAPVEGRVPAELKPGVLHAVQSLLYIIVVASFILAFTLQPFRIPSESMEPTLLVGDFLLVSKVALGFNSPRGILPASSVHRGEIIVFHYPLDPSTHLIKRIVGVPGDHLRMRNNHVYINNKALDEPYAVYRPGPPDLYRDDFPRLQSADPSIDSTWWIAMHRLIEDGDLIVPEDQYFVLGDNRNDSEDSRYWGFVPRADIVGTPLMIYFSLNQTTREDEPSEMPHSQPAARPTLMEAILGLARWDRTFRLVH